MNVEPRDQWVDVAKGGAIVLVVLSHASLFLDDVGLASFWWEANGVLDSFRMPLFFFTAGLFAARTLSLDLRTMMKRRVNALLWLYLMWTFIWTAAFQVLPLVRGTPTWLEFLLIAVWPNESTWFLYGLAVYFVVAWSVRTLPASTQLLLASILSVLFSTGTVDTGNTAMDKMGMYFVFFLAAALFGPRLRTAAKHTRLPHTIAATATYLVVAVVTVMTDAFRIPGIHLVVSSLAVVVGVMAAVRLARLPVFRFLEFLGSRTLPIYVLHYYPILVLCAVIEPVAPRLESIAPVLPPALTAGAILVAFLIKRCTRHVPGLYSLPVGDRPRARQSFVSP